MVAPGVKDLIDVVTGVGTLIGFASVGVGWLVTRKERNAKNERAVEQIDMLATNHFPHMASDMRELKDETKNTNEILTQLRIGQVETNTLLRNHSA